jgi:spermidine/putrescine transport system substrate-binding protein
MENFKNVAPEWVNPDFDPGRKYTVPWAWGTIGIVINTDFYKGPGNSWGIIFDTPDELKGKVNVVPEMNDVMFAATKYVGAKQCADDKETLKKVRDTLVAAKPNWLAMEYNTIEKMGAGDFKATSDWNGSALRQRLANPAIHYFYPKEGYGLWSDNVVVLKEAKNVENAKLFQNFIMDPENAAGLSAFHRYANAIAGSDKYMPADMKDAPEVVIPEEDKAQGELQVLCSPETQEIYTKIWTELQK